MSNFLTRDDVFSIVDIDIKEVTIPEKIRGWGGKKVFIKQLSRGQQDNYLRRQFGAIRMRQDPKAKSQELSAANIYGHDSWLVVQSVVDQEGKRIFKDGDEAKLNEKNGEAIGWLAKQIVEFSGMKEDVEEIESIEKTEEALKN